MKKTALVQDPLFRKHMNGPGFLESPDRLSAVDAAIDQFSADRALSVLQPRDAIFEELELIHSKAYIESIEKTQHSELTWLDRETTANEYSYSASIRAVGGVVESVDAVLSEDFANAFALVRPPGHHAESDAAMGFCIFNNVAVGAEYALLTHGLERVAIVDWDVHHGNGTMHSFYDRPDVLFLSIHQFPLYPGTGWIYDTGTESGKGYSINVPLPEGRGDAEYFYVFTQLLLPAIRKFEPELILVSCGFDAHMNDPLAGMALSSEMFADMTEMLRQTALQLCGGRLVIALEGGYDLDAIREGTSHVLAALCGGWKVRNLNKKIDQSTSKVIHSVAQELDWIAFGDL
jgi:acetoin utilization deacetylase AcuC-like enzyme